MNILDRIVKDKKQEVAAKKEGLPKSFLMQSPLFERACFSMSKSILEGSGIIVELLRNSKEEARLNRL